MHLICAAVWEKHTGTTASWATGLRVNGNVGLLRLDVAAAAAGCAPSYRWSCVIKSEPCRRLWFPHSQLCVISISQRPTQIADPQVGTGFTFLSFNVNCQSEVAEGHGWCCQWKSLSYFGQCYCPSSISVRDLCGEECQQLWWKLCLSWHTPPAGYQRYLQPAWSDWNWIWSWMLWKCSDCFLCGSKRKE